MKTGKLVIGSLLWLAVSAVTVSAQSTDGQSVLQQGQSEYQSAKYGEALRVFQDIIANPQYASLHGDAYFWSSLAYMALGKLSDAQKDLEYFLLNFPKNDNVPNAYFQKGRLLYLQGEYDSAIQVLYTFIKTYGTNPFVANAYYWVGESLYQLGHLDEARQVFSYVVSRYPTSFKVEAAQYRISVIDLMTRERELLQLLRWSNEEALHAQQEYRRREQAYEQAIVAYQRELSLLKGSAPAGASLSSSGPSGGNASLASQISRLEAQIQDLTAKLSAESAGAGGISTATASSQEQELLSLKAKALDLKAFYLDWLASHPAGGK